MHVFQAFLFLEASRKAFQSQRQFVKYKLPSLSKPKDVDLSEMDAEISADAHPVDERGQAEPTSLPSSPISEFPRELGPEPGASVDRGNDDGNASEDAYDSDRLSESSGSPPGSELVTPPLSSNEYAAPFPDAPPPPPAGARPTLRAYASARDLFMSRADSAPAAASPEPTESPSTPSPRRRHSRASTTSSALKMETSPRGEPHRSLHARSSSHPDFRELLEQYAAVGPSNPTRVIRSQLPEPEPAKVASRPRKPSFAGESPGFGFS